MLNHTCGVFSKLWALAALSMYGSDDDLGSELKQAQFKTECQKINHLKKLMAKDIFATSYIYLSGPEKVYLYLTTTK